MSSIVDKIKEKAVDKLSSIEKPSCDLSHVGFKKVTKKEITMESVLSVKNPYDHDLPICTITYKIFSNNDSIASGQLTDPGDVKANDSTDIKLPTSVEYDFLWALMKDVGADGDIDYKLEVGAEFKLPIVGKFTLPLTKAGTWSLKDLF